MLGQWIKGLLILGGLTAGIAAAAVYGAISIAFDVAGTQGFSVNVIIPKGAGLNLVSVRLAEKGVIRRPRLFAVGARLQGQADRLQAGEFKIPARASMEEVLAILMAGDVVQHRMTVPEGLSVSEVVALLIENPVLDGPAPALIEEGSIRPETYYFVRGEKRTQLLRRMQDAQKLLLEELWSVRDPTTPVRNVEDALILASIVEKETARKEERARIAAVFLNRIRKGMRLQSDPTVIYGLAGGGDLDRPIKQSDLVSDTPYNTYRIQGLPPGPISNPGRASLEAVLHPLATEDLYFVADGTGGHVFAKTLNEHNRNVQRWRRFERQNR
jgi:UPF0755 protein